VRKRALVASARPICLNGPTDMAVGARVSEEKEGPESSPDGIGSGLDPAAIALAFNSGSCDPGIAEDLRAYLRNQSALVTDQRHHLQEQFRQLRLGIWDAGRKDEVRAQYQTASTLQMSAADGAELARTTGNPEAQR
jgi:hypothetical protein